jgi:hypothetical protein
MCALCGLFCVLFCTLECWGLAGTRGRHLLLLAAVEEGCAQSPQPSFVSLSLLMASSVLCVLWFGVLCCILE